MQGHSRPELYRSFIEFIRTDVQLERNAINRRMLSAFLWCFLLPAIIVITVLILVKNNILPRSFRNHVDWLVLIFPVFYSLYILGSEVLSQIPANFRRGGVAATLGQAIREGEWRNRVCEVMSRAMHEAAPEDWRWIIASFRVDLEQLQYRMRYLTALAGAVFFLIMQGIDSMADDPGTKVTWTKTSVLGWIETSSSDLNQLVGLALFLVLLYLSGSQTYHSLVRYLNCAELLMRSDEASKNS